MYMCLYVAIIDRFDTAFTENIVYNSAVITDSMRSTFSNDKLSLEALGNKLIIYLTISQLIADLAAHSCAFRIFAVDCGVTFFNALFLSNR